MDLLQRLIAPRLGANLLSGALFGLAAHRMLGAPSDVDASLLVALCAGGMTLTFALMSLNGALTLLRTALCALGLGLLTGVLFALAEVESLRTLFRRDMAGQIYLAWFLLSVVPLPMLRAMGSGQGLGYPAVWAATLELLVIWGAGFGFALLSWGVILPAAKLLDLVGLPASDILFADEALPFVLTGLAMGGGFATVSIWPIARAGEVLARVIRLLALPFVAVMLLFCIALIVNGVTGGERTSAWLMSWSVLLCALLVSTIAGGSGLLMPLKGLWLMLAASLTVLMLPAAGAALWSSLGALWRSSFTPETLAAAALAAFTALLALGYGQAILRGRTIARVNSAAAGALLAWAVLILPGVLSPEALAVRHHLTRFDRGEATVQELPLRAMGLYWGKPGRAGIEHLRQRLANDPAELAHIERMTQPVQAPISLGAQLEAMKELREELAGKLQSLPAGAELAADFAARWQTSPGALRGLITACERSTPGGIADCLVVTGDFLPNEPGEAILLLSLEPGAGPTGRASGWQRKGPGRPWLGRELIGDFYLFDAAESIDRLHAEGALLRALPVQALRLRDQDVFFRPQSSDQRSEP